MRILQSVSFLGLGAALLFGAKPATAQVTLGVIGGVNFASLDDVDANSLTQTFDNRSGFHLGAFLEVGGTGFVIRPGVVYLNAGSLFEGAGFLNQDSFNVSFVSFPLDFRARFGAIDIFAGPEFQALLSTGAEPGFEDDLKSWVVNGGIGAGIRLGPLMPEVRYLFGLSGLTEDNFSVGSVNISTEGGQRTQTLRASLGLAF